MPFDTQYTLTAAWMEVLDTLGVFFSSLSLVLLFVLLSVLLCKCGHAFYRVRLARYRAHALARAVARRRPLGQRRHSPFSRLRRSAHHGQGFR